MPWHIHIYEIRIKKRLDKRVYDLHEWSSLMSSKHNARQFLFVIACSFYLYWMYVSSHKMRDTQSVKSLERERERGGAMEREEEVTGIVQGIRMRAKFVEQNWDCCFLPPILILSICTMGKLDWDFNLLCSGHPFADRHHPWSSSHTLPNHISHVKTRFHDGQWIL